jgi:hypothetical protein
MAFGFAGNALDLSHEKLEDIRRYNHALENLVARRKASIEADGIFFASKTAWKCALLQQSLLFRITMLAIGCADAWNSGNLVSSVLSARALLETIALCEETIIQLKASADTGDVDAIDDLASRQLFSTRNDELIADQTGYRATNVLTFIDKLDKKLSGVRESYDFLSEWCHPNASGHLLTYGEINKQTGTVRFSEASDRAKGIQGHIVTCFMLILFTERAMDHFDGLVTKAAELDTGIGSWVLAQTM